MSHYLDFSTRNNEKETKSKLESFLHSLLIWFCVSNVYTIDEYRTFYETDYKWMENVKIVFLYWIGLKYFMFTLGKYPRKRSAWYYAIAAQFIEKRVTEILKLLLLHSALCWIIYTYNLFNLYITFRHWFLLSPSIG